jgi:hypothetical protein
MPLTSMVCTRKIDRRVGTYNAPSAFTLSLLACVMNVDDTFDAKIPLLQSPDRTQLLYRLLSSNAALH